MASHSTGDGGIPKRGVEKDGLKRVMSLGGAYGTRNYTVKDLRDCKGKRVLVETLPFSPEEAMAAEAVDAEEVADWWDWDAAEAAGELEPEPDIAQGVRAGSGGATRAGPSSRDGDSPS